MKKLYLLDGMALIYRAYFAMSKNPRFTTNGVNTSAIMGFANSLLEVLKKQEPTHIAVVFDTEAPTARHEEFESYKANRQTIPEDLAASIPYIYRLTKGFNIPVLALDGYEADDIIGTLAKQAEQLGFDVYCMTPDKDFGQLVTDRIHILKPARFGDGAEVLGVKEIKARWEVEDVTQVIDILGLWGDAVDNIPGIPGIGEKTAKKLIREYGSIEGLIANSHKLKGKQRENVETFGEQGLLSKKLATIQLDVPIQLDEEALRLKEPDKTLLEPLFAELEFRTLGKRVFGDTFSVASSSSSSNPQMDLFGQSLPASEDGLRGPSPQTQTGASGVDDEASVAGRSLLDVPHEYHVVDDETGIVALAAKLATISAFCFDTEATGTDANTAAIVGLSFAIRPYEAWYVPLPDDAARCIALLEHFKPLFENPAVRKIGQNLKYDILLLARYGIRVQGALFDTMLAHYLIDPDTRHGMDALAESYLGYQPIPITDLIGPRGIKQLNMRDVPVDQAADYASEDADITLQLSQIFEPMLEERHVAKLATDVEFPLVYVLADMERTGVQVDVEMLREISGILEADIAQLENRICEKAGVRFNIASPKQLGEVLFDKLQLDPKAKKTKTGQYKTGEDVLLALAHKSDIVQDILNFRQLQKLKSTYVDAIPALINPDTGRVHTSYNQAVAATGRLSSTNPNLQNIPIRTTRGREIRKAFVARDREHVLLAADYSQIELRLVAEMSRDAGMLDAFAQGLDIHRATAARVYGVSLEEVTSEQRRNAKAVNFGIIYGQTAFGLSQNLGIPRREAADIIDQYFLQYPGIKQYMTDTIAFAREHGYVETLLKRRRYLRDINSANQTVRGFAERNAINAPIQGSAADMIKVAMIGIHKEITERDLRGKMTMQVHDELVFDVPRTEADIFRELIERHMKGAFQLSVPILVDIGEGDNWLEAH